MRSPAPNGSIKLRANGSWALLTDAIAFIHRDDMEAEGYGAYLSQVEDVQ